MKLSELFTKTRRQAPKDETSVSAQLLIRAGFIYKDAAGVYALLPLGLRVFENLKLIIREEMNALGGQELIMTTLQRRELWQRTDRWGDDKVDVWFKSKLKNNSEVGLAWSHEEQITEMMTEYIDSYRDLPISVYQFQTKLRNELRAKSGILRTREFVMKDLYSYARSEQEHKKIYDDVTKAYLKIFDRIGLGDKTFLTFASGGDFTEFSHEFQTVTEAGEDTIHLDEDAKVAINDEVHSEKIVAQLKLDKTNLKKVKAAEVGNIFSFGTAKSEQLKLYFTDEDGTDKPVVLGSYGIGVTRLIGVVAEVFSDEAGLVWPKAIAPAKAHLIGLGDDKAVKQAADKLYADLQKAGNSVIYDDRSTSAGQKFADADLIGCPLRLTISAKTLKQNAAELKPREGETLKLIPLSEVHSALKT